MGGIYLDVPAFKCPVCGGDVGAELDIWGKPKVVSVIFKCHDCGRFADIDATDLLGEARDYFDDELKRGGRRMTVLHPREQIDLKDCPHCGGRAEFRDGSSTKPYIRCSGCGCRTYGSHDLKKLAAIWNRRSGE